MINKLDKWSFNQFRVAKAEKRESTEHKVKLGQVRRRLEELRENKELESLYLL